MPITLSVLEPSSLIKRTTSRCPVCVREVSAEIHAAGAGVVMRKACPEHGRFEVLLAADRRFYHDTAGAPGNASGCCGSSCGCGPAAPADGAASADPFETLSTCIALIEIVDSCNLTCPTCYAASPFGVGEKADCVPFDEFTRRVGGVLARKGFIDVLQLSGGEPTIHPEFFRILEWTLDRPDVGYILINTNLVRIATDDAFRDRLAQTRRDRGRFELYAQFDGVQEAGQRELRGADLRETRRRAIDGAGAAGVPTTLAMVVTPRTRPHLGDALRFGLERPHCRGIVFQPMFTSGRVPAPGPADAPATGRTVPLTIAAETPRPISVGDVITSVVEQSEGLLTADDFTPLPCGDPNCHTISYILRRPGHSDGPVPLGRLLDLGPLQSFLRDRVDYRLEDLARCGCETEPLGRIIKDLEISPEHPFRIYIKPFMDAWTFDQDRIDRCCTHVIRPDGSLDSFCRYYLSRP